MAQSTILFPVTQLPRPQPPIPLSRLTCSRPRSTTTSPTIHTAESVHALSPTGLPPPPNTPSGIGSHSTPDSLAQSHTHHSPSSPRHLSHSHQPPRWEQGSSSRSTPQPQVKSSRWQTTAMWVLALPPQAHSLVSHLRIHSMLHPPPHPQPLQTALTSRQAASRWGVAASHSVHPPHSSPTTTPSQD